MLTLDELADAGIGPRQAQRLAEAGFLHRLYDGVYAVGHRGLSLDGRRRAAVVACGARAVLSHRSAAAAWAFAEEDEERWHVSVPLGHHPRPPGVRVRQSRRLEPTALTVVRAVPITTPARTIIDLAGELSYEALERVVHDALVRRVTTVPQVLAEAAGLSGRRGTARLRRMLDDAGVGPTRSVLEQRFARLCTEAGLPAARRNVRVAGFEVDAVWVEERVVVELDGGQFHATPRAFERDRRRDAALAAAGYLVVRITWRRLAEEPAKVVAELRRTLAHRSERG